MLDILIDMDVLHADFAGAKICRYDPTDLFRLDDVTGSIGGQANEYKASNT